MNTAKQRRTPAPFMKPNANGYWPRRQFIGQTAASVALLAMAGCRSATPAPAPTIIDCHTHFYDPTRPQGVPWPPRAEPRLYRTILPKDLMAVAAPLGVTGTVVVEASEWVEDNQWVLDLAEKEPVIVGLVGSLPADHPDFAAQLRRFGRHRLFRGLRVRGPVALRVGEAAIRQNLALLADFDLALDYNANTEGLPLAAALAASFPRLRIVLNHVANVAIDGQPPPAAWVEGMRRAAASPNVWLKLSGLVEGSRRRDGAAPRQPEFYRPVMEAAWEIFGEDRLIYGSNWPVSALYADYATVFGLARDFIQAKGPRAAAKFFSGNALAAYKWVRRSRG